MPYSALQAITGIIKANGGNVLEQQLIEPQTAAEFAEFKALVKKASAGNKTVLPALRAHLDKMPDVWQGTGNMTHLIQHTCIDRMFGKDEVAKECVMRTTAAFIRELEGPNPSPLETLLTQQIGYFCIPPRKGIFHAEGRITYTFWYPRISVSHFMFHTSFSKTSKTL